MKIACINDQIFPSRDTDTEQIFSSFSALGRISDVEVTFFFPQKWGVVPPDADTLAAYYDVEKTFFVNYTKSLFPTFRGLEKPSHALSVLSAEAFRNADVVYSRNLPTVLSVLALSDKKVVYETFRPWADQVRALKPALKWMVRHPRFLGAVTHSRLAGQSFTDIGLAENKLFVAYNGFDADRISPQLDKSQARKKLGLPDKGRIVSYAGHVNMAKGLGILLKLARRITDVLFVIVGSYGKGEVETKAALLPNVRIVPWQTFRDTAPYLYASDVLFIPPTAGPLTKVGNTVLPIKTYFYMASGRPIFGPATPDLTEILRNGENAVLVPPDDFEATLDALSRLLEDETLMCRLGDQAKKDVAPFTWDNRAQAVLRFIENGLRTAP